MPTGRLQAALRERLDDLESTGTAKGSEHVITEVLLPRAGLGPRYRLSGHERDFLKMNSNSYLGLSQHPAVLDAGEGATRRYGSGPGAVRFIAGTYQSHVSLEQHLADFHRREAAVVLSSAYAAVLSTLASLITSETVVLSDELNHNCIINAIRMTRPAAREVYPHLDMKALDEGLAKAAEKGKRALIVTDGVFSMRGDFADLAAVQELAVKRDEEFEENVVVVVDDSHGVGAYGTTGRGTEEVTNGTADVLIGTLGKAFGVNGGYVTAEETVCRYLRESGPMYIYSNPISPGEAAAAEMSISVLESPEGEELLSHLSMLTERFEEGLVAAGLETIAGPHPIVPLMVRDTDKTAALVAHLFENGILATGLNYPVVPKGDEEIRFQINADHTVADIDFVLEVLREF